MNLLSNLRRYGANTFNKKVTTALLLVRMASGHELWVALTRVEYIG